MFYFFHAGVTGPVLLFDEALVTFADGEALKDSISYLHWRVWIGIWLVIIALLVAMFQGSVLVKFFTKFTKDIFASLVALLFIFEAFNKLAKIFKAHPLQSIKTLADEFGILLAEKLGAGQKDGSYTVGDNGTIFANDITPVDPWFVVYENDTNVMNEKGKVIGKSNLSIYGLCRVKMHPTSCPLVRAFK